MSNYKIGFWNYVKCGEINSKNAVNDWRELGMNLAMSFTYCYQKHNKQDLIDMLDECLKNNISVIVCDERTQFRTLIKEGEESFKIGVQNAIEDFGWHKAVFGFSVGDEPDAKEWESAISAYNIVQNANKNLTAFINFYPYFIDDSFNQILGVERDDYWDKLDDFLKRTGAKILSYDFYGQCNYFDKELWIDVYFKNLNNFRRVAENNNAQLYTCLLSVGHWGYRVPTEDDMRWQISTAVAHGAVGLLWFYLYARTVEFSYRNAPIDMFYKKTDTYDKLCRQNRIFGEYFAEKLEGFNFLSVQHYLKQYGETQTFDGSGLLKNVKTVINEKPFSISHFENANGEKCVVVVNLCQDEPSAVNFEFVYEWQKYNGLYWFAPGQMMIFTEESCI